MVIFNSYVKLPEGSLYMLLVHSRLVQGISAAQNLPWIANSATRQTGSKKSSLAQMFPFSCSISKPNRPKQKLRRES